MTDVPGDRARLWRRGLSVWLPATLASILVLATVVAATLGDATSSIGSRPPAAMVLTGLFGLVAICAAAWVAATRHPHAALGLAVAAVGAALPLWALWSAVPDQLRTTLLAVAPVAVAGVSQVAMRWSPRAHDRARLKWVYGLTLAAVAVHVLGYNPFADPGCSMVCVDVPTVAGDVLSNRAVVTAVAVLTLAATTIAVASVAGSPPRPAPGIVIVGTVAALVAMTAPWVIRSLRWGERIDGAVLVLPLIGAGMIGAAVLAAALRSHRTRRAMARTVELLNRAEVSLGAGEAPVDGLQFSLPDDGRWVDLSGATVAERPGVEYLVVADRAGPVLRIPVERRREAADMFDALTPAARLAVKNAQLTAITRARIADVRGSQARVVAAHDAERTRIERDLHDGAQQRLVSAALYLSHARSLRGHDHDALGEAEVPLRHALVGLRKLAHGATPDVLGAGALGAALPQLADASPVPVTLDVDGELAVPPDVARTAYAAAAAVMERAPGPVRVRVRRDEVLAVSIETDDPDGFADLPDLVDVSDRVGALGGTISVGAGTVTVRLPCGW
jgi:signal transduction histidine kinase